MKRFFMVLVAAFITISCHKDKSSSTTSSIAFSNVLILGNSITFSPYNPTQGWNGNWGMAASVADSDYVHLLTTKFQHQNSNCKVTSLNISAFETGFANYNLDSAFLSYKNTKPDLVIIRIGENVPNGFNTALFDTKYLALVNYFKTASPDTRIFAAGSFFEGKDAVDAEMKKYSSFLSLSYLAPDVSNESWGLFTNYSIESHPSDKGMRAICNAMWLQIEALK